MPEDETTRTFEWSRAQDPGRRERTTLFVVVYSVVDSRRRGRVRQLLSAFGVEVAAAAFEVPTSPAGARALERALAMELAGEDFVRIYPVCARCRADTRVWGEGEIAGLSPALIF